MTSPIEDITVECPKCGHLYQDWFRGSVNLDLDDFDEEYLDQCSSATCPEVTRGHTLSLLTESFLRGHRYAQIVQSLDQIGTCHERGDVPGIAVGHRAAVSPFCPTPCSVNRRGVR